MFEREAQPGDKQYLLKLVQRANNWNQPIRLLHCKYWTRHCPEWSREITLEDFRVVLGNKFLIYQTCSGPNVENTRIGPWSFWYGPVKTYDLRAWLITVTFSLWDAGLTEAPSLQKNRFAQTIHCPFCRIHTFCHVSVETSNSTEFFGMGHTVYFISSLHPLRQSVTVGKIALLPAVGVNPLPQ